MKAQIEIWFVSLCCVAAQCHGQGTLHITFDGPPVIPPGAAYTVTNYYESGMSFSPISGSYGFTRVGAGYPGDPQDGTAYLRAAFTQALMFRFTNGSAFDLVSVDLAEYSTAFQYPVTVHFVGYRSDGSMVSADVTTDGSIDGTGPLADFQTFNFQGWTGLSRVEIPTDGWSLDNLMVTSIPEPASCALLLAGGLLFCALKFRK